MSSNQDWECGKAWLREAGAVLVAAGAGFSAGLSVNGDDGWEGVPRPPHGSRAMDWARAYRSGEDMWGTEGPRLLRTIRNWCRLTHSAYPSLAKVLEGMPHFIFTSNVDNRFHAAGFDPEHIYTPQGDMTILQCSRPCSGVGIPAEPLLTKLVDEGGINTRTWLVDRPELLPRCPRCSAPAYKWTRHNELFTHGPSDEAQAEMIKWLKKHHGSSLVVLEVGCGMSTPAVCRFPAEAIARQLEAKLIRVSNDVRDARVPQDLLRDGVAVSCVGTAEAAMTALANSGPLPVVDPDGNKGVDAYGQYIGHDIKFAPTQISWEQWLEQLKDDPSRF